MVWGGMFAPSRLGGLRERRELPQRGPGSILKATERSFLYLYDEI